MILRGNAQKMVGIIVNQEDSLLMNESAIQKGYMRAQALKKYFETIKKNPASSQTGIFMKPDPNKVDNLKDANYDKLSEEGYAKVETVIRDGDVIIGMVNPKPTTREDEKPYKDNSTIYKSLVPGAIDKVITEVNNDGYPIIKIRVRSERIPAVGDKFSSRAGQKGTVGFKIHRADLPFTKSGLIPDIIINPNCMPKRMTIGQLIECLLGKVCAIKGVYGDATPFTGVNINKINDDLVALGHEAWGNETMYNGMTGQRMEVKIFIGPTYYQRLKQMVGDKTHSRARGATQLLTRRKAASVISKIWLVCRYAGNTFKLRERLKKIDKKIINDTITDKL
ncbi:intein-containing DNA-directed RNA polymerase subunit 2 [Bandra megavirus]|uniref:DNA-directed RNA polymerase n=1 Tax=Bandra megavirus TaxID=2071566 RepID=A0A2K9V7T8_9VIRU|nr:intein-containing DNA-directed RNA polymerase subunit 2 [Bandra megavirus]